MLPVFEFLKNFFRFRDVSTDNGVFQLHYRWTVAFLLAFSVLVNLKQYWGDAIVCISDFKEERNKVLETFCWIETTFTIPSAYNDTVGEEVPYPGITNHKGDKSDLKYHAFYQWVGLMLFFQAVLFYIPRFVWKSEEGGLMKTLVLGLSAPVSKEKDQENMKMLRCYLKSTWGTHEGYVAKYLFCEIANFVNVVLQLVLMEKFLGGNFISYGLQVIGVVSNPYGQNILKFPGFWVFPRMTKCTFHEFGPSGDINKMDAYCLLPLNIIHRKIYVFLFVWFLTLAIASALIIVLRLASLFLLPYREKVLQMHATLCPKSKIQRICQKFSFADWFFLNMVLKNISSMNCRQIVSDVTDEIPTHGFRVPETSVKTAHETIF